MGRSRTAQRLAEVARHIGGGVGPAQAGFGRRNDISAVTLISIDVGVLERSGAVAVVTGAFAWDDVGTWQALARVRPKDPSGNVLVGPGVLLESHDCIVWSDRDPVVLCGVQDLVVVQANGRILVMPTERAAAMKQILDALPPEIRDIET
jgi:mannose-1-phosphate guanylyltransferase